MDALQVGTQVNVKHMAGVPEDEYTLRVEVIEISSSYEFIGRVDHILAASGLGAPGEITGGDIYRSLKGQQTIFKRSHIIPSGGAF